MLVLGARTQAADKSGVKPEVLSLPSGPGSIEGLGPSFEPQLNTGAAPYAVKLTVPPGVNKHQPDLALSYSSGAGNGHFGIGWSLAVPSIMRQTDKGQPHFDDTDVFVYSNGEELVPLADDTWRCENESDFMRFRRDGDGWEVRDRSGRIYHLGTYPADGDRTRQSRVEHGGSGYAHTFKWYVDSFEDTNGNRIEYFYSTFPDSPGELYLTEVRYNINGDNYNSVTIDYELRPDAFTDYRAGFKIRTGRVGTRIRMLSQGALVREYVLGYAATADEIMDPQMPGAVPLMASLLTKITQYDKNGEAGGNYLPPLRFGYTHLYTADRDNPPLDNFPGPEDVDLNGDGIANGPGVHRMLNPPINVSFTDGNSDFIDIDGDGFPDVLSTTAGRHVYYRNLGRDQFQAGDPITVGGSNPGFPLSAAGAALADLDGDGLADLVNESAFGNSVRIYRNRGDGSWAAGAEFSGALLSGVTGPDVRLLDVNFDKAIDVVQSVSGSRWEICLNSNSGDTDYPPYAAPERKFPGPEDVDRDHNGRVDAGTWNCAPHDMPFPAEVVFGNPGADVQLGDMNGDRLQDVVYIQQTGSASKRVMKFWPNMGMGNFDAPVTMSVTGSPSNEIDLGGPVSPGTQDTLRLMDINGDGLSDLVKIDNGVVRVWVNLGGDRLSSAVVFSGTPPYVPGETTLRVADMNGNGSADVVWIAPSGPVADRWQYLDFAPSAKANQLHIIDNGLGRRIFIDYRSSSEFYLDAQARANPWHSVTPFPVQVVSRVTITPGLDLDNVEGPDQYVTDFVYRDGFFDGYEKEFRGFAWVKKIERGDPDAPTQVTRTTFHTGGPDGVDNNGDGAVDERTAAGGSEEESLKGRILQEETATEAAGGNSSGSDGADAPNSETFRRTTTKWNIRRLHASDGGTRGIPTMDDRAVAFAVQAEIDVSVIELTNTPVQLKTINSYDDFGNQTKKHEYGVNAERTTESAFAVDIERWITDRPQDVTIRDGAGHRVSETRDYYDGDAYVGLPLGQLTRGNLSRQEAWIRADTYVDKTRSAFDAYGNIVGMLDPLGNPADPKSGHAREIAYDADFHTFPVQETIHIGHGRPQLQVTAAYDIGFGVVTASTDFNGHQTAYGYDSFGRQTSTIKPGDSPTFPTSIYEYRLADPLRGMVLRYNSEGALTLESGAPTASSVTTRQREQQGTANTFDTVAYVDGMGRKLSTVEEADSGFVVKNAVRFNSRGIARDSLQPYSAATSDYGMSPPGTPSTTTRYDATLRVLSRINPPDQNGQLSQATTTYGPLLRMITDEMSHRKNYTTDGLAPLDQKHERLVAVEEINGADRYVTHYGYDPLDELVRVVDAQNNTITRDYDGLQRLVAIHHPDSGTITYAYDAASNITRTVDARGDVIEYTYDGANRILSEDYLDDSLSYSAHRTPDVEFHYDLAAGPVDTGDHTSITGQNVLGECAWIADPSGEEHHSYDDRARDVAIVKKLIDPLSQSFVSYKTEMAFDSMDRLHQLIYPDNDQVTYEYNSRGLVSRIDSGSARCIICGTQYEPSGKLARVDYGNGDATTYQYDSRLRLIDLHTSNDRAATRDIVDYGYTLDPVSNILRIDDKRPTSSVADGDPRRNTQIFAYDDLDRLVQVRYSPTAGQQSNSDDLTISYRYDAIGNMVAQSAVNTGTNSVTNLGVMAYGGEAGAIGRQPRRSGDPPGPHSLTTTQGGPHLYEYDENGNTTRVDAGVQTWDFKNRLVGFESANVRATYVYDYSGRRVAKSVAYKDGTRPSAVVLYPAKHFEMREGNAGIKYVFMDNTRVARIIGARQAPAQLVQRFRVVSGWNLIALAVQADDAAEQLGLHGHGQVAEAYRWDQGTRTFVLVGTNEQLPASTVLWIRMNSDAILAVSGTYVHRGEVQVSEDRTFFGNPSLGSLNLADFLKHRDVSWTYDAYRGAWRGGISGDLSFTSDAPTTMGPGEAIYLGDRLSNELPSLAAVGQSIEYYHQDHLGSSNSISDANGDLVAEFAFFPYGRLRNATAFANVDRSSLEPYLFTQKERDGESELDDFGARMLASQTGRFNEVDPAAISLEPAQLIDPQLLNPYAYCADRPMNYVDHTGLNPHSPETEHEGHYETAGEWIVKMVTLGGEGANLLMESTVHHQVNAATSVARFQAYDLFAKAPAIYGRYLIATKVMATGLGVLFVAIETAHAYAHEGGRGAAIEGGAGLVGLGVAGAIAAMSSNPVGWAFAAALACKVGCKPALNGLSNLFNDVFIDNSLFGPSTGTRGTTRYYSEQELPPEFRSQYQPATKRNSENGKP